MICLGVGRTTWNGDPGVVSAVAQGGRWGQHCDFFYPAFILLNMSPPSGPPSFLGFQSCQFYPQFKSQSYHGLSRPQLRDWLASAS